MATVFCDAEGIVLVDYLEHGSTITGPYYADRKSSGGTEGEETRKVEGAQSFKRPL